MKLKIGKSYKHVTGSGTNICVYSHSDQSDHNHIFTVTKNVKNWKLDKFNQVSIPTWDLQRNMQEIEITHKPLD